MATQDRNGPQTGDVLITTEAGLHFISVVPHPHRLYFQSLEQATNIASQWARANEASLWRAYDGQAVELLRDGDGAGPSTIPQRRSTPNV